MKRVLVTGAAGFLGSQLVTCLYRNGINVCGVGHTGLVKRHL